MRRILTAGLLLAAFGFSQNPTIRTTVPLVQIPTSVTDRNGHPIYGLTASDFIVLDNGSERTIQVDPNDSGLAPIALVVAIQTSDLSSAALAKIQKVGSMITGAVVGENGEVAVLSFDDDIKILQDFTNDANAVGNAFHALKQSDSSRARMLDAADDALGMLSSRPGARRPSILIIGETRDRGSKSKLADLLAKAQRTEVTIYSLNYSVWITPFTAKPDDYAPANDGGGNYLAAFTETARLAKKNTAEALTRATGGRRIGFETQSKLENDLMALGAEIHSRYLLSFTPEQDHHPAFHKVEVKIKDRPDAVIKARAGYWTPLPAAQ